MKIKPKEVSSIFIQKKNLERGSISITRPPTIGRYPTAQTSISTGNTKRDRPLRLIYEKNLHFYFLD